MKIAFIDIKIPKKVIIIAVILAHFLFFHNPLPTKNKKIPRPRDRILLKIFPILKNEEINNIPISVFIPKKILSPAEIQNSMETNLIRIFFETIILIKKTIF